MIGFVFGLYELTSYLNSGSNNNNTASEQNQSLGNLEKKPKYLYQNFKSSELSKIKKIDTQITEDDSVAIYGIKSLKPPKKYIDYTPKEGGFFNGRSGMISFDKIDDLKNDIILSDEFEFEMHLFLDSDEDVIEFNVVFPKLIYYWKFVIRNNLFSIKEAYHSKSSLIALKEGKIFGEKSENIDLKLNLKFLHEKLYVFINDQFLFKMNAKWKQSFRIKQWEIVEFTDEIENTNFYIKKLIINELFVSERKTDQLTNQEENIQNFKIKINELKDIQLKIGDKLTKIIKEIEKLKLLDRKIKLEIEDYKSLNQIIDFNEALGHPNLKNNLSLLQENKAINKELINKANDVYSSFEDLKFLVRRRERDIEIFKVLSEDERKSLLNTLEIAYNEFLPQAEEFVLPEINKEDLPSLESVWLEN